MKDKKKAIYSKNSNPWWKKIGCWTYCSIDTKTSLWKILEELLCQIVLVAHSAKSTPTQKTQFPMNLWLNAFAANLPFCCTIGKVCCNNLYFLVANKRLYKRLCPSVRPSVGWLVGRLVGRSVVIELESVKTRISAPAHPSATGIGRVSGLVYFINIPRCPMPLWVAALLATL